MYEISSTWLKLARMSLKGRLASNNKRLTLRGYVGISAIGRTQTWIRQQ